MNKQELIDKAVEQFKGVWPGKAFHLLTTQSNWMGHKMHSGKFNFATSKLAELDDEDAIYSLSIGYWCIVSGKEEFTTRAKELGWINGYKYGVEYPTNGKRPDLPDDVDVDINFANLGNDWHGPSKVDHWKWDARQILRFRIVDERYKPLNIPPAPEQPVYKQPTASKDDWFANGELPPVGAVCEMLDADLAWRQVEILAYSKKGVVVEWNSKEFLQSKDRKFRPIKSEREKFHESALELYDDNTQVWLDAMFNAGFKAPGDKDA